MEQKIMVLCPMKDRSEEEIERCIKKAKEYASQNGYVFVDSYFNDECRNDSSIKHPGLCYLGRSLEKMSECDVVYFCKGWDSARGCEIEHNAAEAYGLQIIYE